MNAIQLLRSMHADTRRSFKLILGIEDPKKAGDEWKTLQPLLTLHEQIEAEFLYSRLQAEVRAGTLLGDWELIHDNDVAIVKQLVDMSQALAPGSPEWRMCIGRVADALNKHVTEEEGQIFPRIEEAWDSARLASTAEEMQKRLSPRKRAPVTAAEPTQGRR